MMTGAVFAGTINLPQTGQTQCWDTSGNQIPCSGTGQDGEIQAGVAWPEPRFTPNADTTVTDNLTGLVWARDGNIMPTRDPGWDADGTANDGAVTWQHALDYVAKLNAENYLTHNDWRLPNVNELESLVNANEANSATWLNTEGFTNVQAFFYWSSTSFPFNSIVWPVNMLDGFMYYDLKSSSNYVWPVRSGQCGSSAICLPKTGQTKCYDESGAEISCTGTGQDGEIQAGVAWPDPRFTDNGDETVTDDLTELMWTKDANLPGDSKTWQEALDYVKGMNNGTYSNFGHTDWRLPNRKELHSLIDYSQVPVLPADHPFTNVQNFYYWSSTTYADYPAIAWIVYMGQGFLDGGNKYLNWFYVWPVRGPETTLNVNIDIKPGSFPNSINLKSKGNVPVAILSSPTFDATTVDRGTVVFAGAPALSIGGSPEDVNGDGLLDLVLHFSTQSLNLKSGDTEACLTGKTLSGQEFEGCDSVKIVK